MGGSTSSEEVQQIQQRRRALRKAGEDALTLVCFINSFCGFAASEIIELIKFSHVCSSWRDAVQNYCGGSWERICVSLKTEVGFQSSFLNLARQHNFAHWIFRAAFDPDRGGVSPNFLFCKSKTILNVCVAQKNLKAIRTLLEMNVLRRIPIRRPIEEVEERENSLPPPQPRKVFLNVHAVNAPDSFTQAAMSPLHILISQTTDQDIIENEEIFQVIKMLARRAFSQDESPSEKEKEAEQQNMKKKISSSSSAATTKNAQEADGELLHSQRAIFGCTYQKSLKLLFWFVSNQEAYPNIDLNVRDRNGETPLSLIVKENRAHKTADEAAFKMLLDAGAKVSSRNVKGESFINFTGKKNEYSLSIELYKQVIENAVEEEFDFDSFPKDYGTSIYAYSHLHQASPLQIAAEANNLEVTKVLLDVAKVNAKQPGDSSGNSALHSSVRYHFEISKLLLEHGANPNALNLPDAGRHRCFSFDFFGIGIPKSNLQTTPVHEAASSKFIVNGIFELLVTKYGADVNAAAGSQTEWAKTVTPLWCAIGNGNLHKVEDLLHLGASTRFHVPSPLPLNSPALLPYMSYSEFSARLHGEKHEITVIVREAEEEEQTKNKKKKFNHVM